MVSDVDVGEGTPQTLQLTMSVSKGTLAVTVPNGVTVSITVCSAVFSPPYSGLDLGASAEQASMSVTT